VYFAVYSGFILTCFNIVYVNTGRLATTRPCG